MTTGAHIEPAGRRAPLRLAPPALLSDEALAGRVRAGDERAFEVLYRRYRDRLHRYCGSILRQPEDAEEALQSTMLAAFRSLVGSEERALAVRPWLYRIAHNQCISMLRRRPAAPVEELSGGEVSREGEPQARLEVAERLDLLREDLLALPDDQRGALVMRELGGLSHQQIADALDERVAGVKQLIYQARAALAGMEEGRRMDCGEVRRRLSDGDRRVVRSRGIAAHLRACRGCRSFRDLNAARPAHLAALAPALPLAAAERILATVLGSSGGLGGGGGGALAAAATTSASLPALGGGLAAKLAVVAAVGIAGGSVAVVPAVLDHPGPAAGRPAGPGASPAASPSAPPGSPPGIARTALSPAASTTVPAGPGLRPRPAAARPAAPATPPVPEPAPARPATVGPGLPTQLGRGSAAAAAPSPAARAPIAAVPERAADAGAPTLTPPPAGEAPAAPGSAAAPSPVAPSPAPPEQPAGSREAGAAPVPAPSAAPPAR